MRQSLERRVERPLDHLRQLGDVKANVGRLRVVEDLVTAVGDAQLTQERAPERIPHKRALYAEMEAIADPDAIIASNTSALTWSDLSPDLSRPD